MRFLAVQDEEIAHTIIEMLPQEVRGATANFYKFWIESGNLIGPHVTW